MTNTLAAALFLVPDIPIQSIDILVGIDKSMSECRALTILIGNNVACVVISLLEVELDKDKPHETMGRPIQLGEALEPGARELLYTGSKAHLHINCHARIA
jgi:aerobic C4-dicarboxylate transport protein